MKCQLCVEWIPTCICALFRENAKEEVAKDKEEVAKDSQNIAPNEPIFRFLESGEDSEQDPTQQHFLTAVGHGLDESSLKAPKMGSRAKK